MTAHHPLHTEIRFEDAIEAWLINRGGWAKGSTATFDPTLGLDPVELLAFVTTSQPKVWSKLVERHGSAEQASTKLVQRVAGEIDRRGTIDVFRRGVVVLGVSVRLVHFRPGHHLTQELLDLYAMNRATLLRQLRYSAKTEDELDLAFLVNGIPTHDAELKNPLSGQHVEDAKRQYRQDRDPAELYFARRSMVHFAVDPDLVFLATKLEGPTTAFLPFNLGKDGAGGNPANGAGYDVAYLWERIWQLDAWLDILARFIHVERTEIDGKSERKGIFPRFHQWDATNQLVAHAREYGAGQRYLVEHSAGSGKSNTISWLAYSLMNLHDGSDTPVFDKVVVVSDRRVLDKQLRDTISAFDHTPGVVETADKSSNQLADALASAGARIVVTTLQKFPFVVERASEFKGKRYAILVDEAHSSQTGETAQKLKLALGTRSSEDDALREAEAAEIRAAEADDAEEALLAAVGARIAQPNLSFFAFTATPKQRTLELFGTRGHDGKYRPFHLYSMRQAIDEGFILDVLASYTTYHTYYKVARKTIEDPKLDKRKATAAIARFVSLHERQFDEKAELIVDHFRRHTARKIGGKAKAMWVTRSRLHAVRSYQALRRYIAKQGYSIGVLVAFSGTVTSTGITYTEPELNGFPEGHLPRKFRTDAYQILVVAEKYQTGYDEPLLHTMFVDKKLESVKAVQTLSRLNRILPPDKEDTFVLDFVNDVDEIQDAFRPFFEESIAEETDPNLLYNAEDALLGYGVIDLASIDGLVVLLTKPEVEPGDHAKLHQLFSPAVARYKMLEAARREDFKRQLRHFTRLYAFLAQVVSYTDIDLERLYGYGRLLQRRLPAEHDPGLDLGGELQLTHLRIQKTGDSSLSLTEGEGEVPGFRGDAAGSKVEEPETALLSDLIRLINERFGMGLGKADQLVFEQIAEEMTNDEELRASAVANPIENFRYGFDRKFEPIVVDRYESNTQLFDRLLGDPTFAAFVKAALVEEVFERIRRSGQQHLEWHSP